MDREVSKKAYRALQCREIVHNRKLLLSDNQYSSFQVEGIFRYNSKQRRTSNDIYLKRLRFSSIS